MVIFIKIDFALICFCVFVCFLHHAIKGLISFYRTVLRHFCCLVAGDVSCISRVKCFAVQSGKVNKGVKILPVRKQSPSK